MKTGMVVSTGVKVRGEQLSSVRYSIIAPSDKRCTDCLTSEHHFASNRRARITDEFFVSFDAIFIFAV